MNQIRTSLIVAMAENRCIGKDNHMPWHISEDLKRFKSLTMGHPVIMGRKTFESILSYLKKPLPGRTNIVVSRSGFKTGHDDVPVFMHLSDAIVEAKNIAAHGNKNEIFIIGGAQIYMQAIDMADYLNLTKVHRNIEGDAFFPEFDESAWTETFREDHLDHDPPFSFITLCRS